MLSMLIVTFSLTILAEEWRIANDAVERALELSWELDRLFKVVFDKLFEDGEAFIVFEKLQLWLALVFSG